MITPFRFILVVALILAEDFGYFNRIAQKQH